VTDSSDTAEHENDSRYPWSTLTRGTVSVLLAAYLFIVLMGPLSNPIASQHLTGPISRWLAPVHQALFLGHGYRFFGPDPGPSHLLIYKIKTSDGKLIEGKFPDRTRHWPRLLYHRWFMLSETIFEEHAFALDEVSQQQSLKQMDDEIAKYKQNGRIIAARDLQDERDRQASQYEVTRARINQLVTGVAQYLLMKNDGQSIELFVQERLIPLPQDVVDGIKLNDPSYLLPARKIAEQTRKTPAESTGKLLPVITPDSSEGN
jgi:hypothetical protein